MSAEQGHPVRPAPARFRRMALIGVGQMGGSMALGARAAGLVDEVVGVARSSSSAQKALELRIADRVEPTAAGAVADADLVVLATPVRSLGALAAEIAPLLGEGSVVIDVGSVKGPAIAAVESALPPGAAFVGCHPIAGTERSGPESANPGLFRGRRCIICPSARSTPAALAAVEALWLGLGAVVARLDAAAHDRVLAAGSHMPHVAAYALAQLMGQLDDATAATVREMSPTSLRDTTRVAESSPAMWRDIFLDNATELLPLIDRMQAAVSELRAAVAAGDAAAVERWLEVGRAGRRRVIGGEP